jgi:hypothetical protein
MNDYVDNEGGSTTLERIRGFIDHAVPARLKKTVTRVFLVVVVLWLANVGAVVVWSGMNPCLRSHTEYLSHPDPDGDNVIEVCDWYQTDPARNPWSPRNEFHTLKNLLTH